MMYAVLSLGLALLGGIVRLAQVLRLSAPLLYGALVSRYSARGIWPIPLWRTAFSLCWWGLRCFLGGDADSSRREMIW